MRAEASSAREDAAHKVEEGDKTVFKSSLAFFSGRLARGKRDSVHLLGHRR